MKKIIIGLVLLLFISTTVEAADVNIVITIPSAQVVRVQKILQIYPIPQIPDPTWIDPDDGSEAPLIDEFTQKQWFKILITRYLKSLVQQVERNEAEQLARDAVSEEEVAE
jgi:hypothetical protein